MAYPVYLREKARQIRREKKLTLDEIAERLALPRTTVFYWIRDIPIPRTERQSAARRRATRAHKARAAHLREIAYRKGLCSFHGLCEHDPTFRDFVVLFMTEGHKRTRNAVEIANSDPGLVELGTRWIRALTQRKVAYSIQYHADQDLGMLRGFWANRLGIDPGAIVLLRKSNSDQLAGRTWRSKFGVMTVRTSDTYFRSRLQAWMDCMQREWLDSARIGV